MEHAQRAPADQEPRRRLEHGPAPGRHVIVAEELVRVEARLAEHDDECAE
jgi:hypothetical protein